MRIILTVGLFLTVGGSSLLHAEQWPQFRGATGTGVSTEGNLPENWSMQSGILWETMLPGRGNSSPAVTSDRIHLTTQTEDGALWVLTYERASGELLHRVKAGQGKLAATGAPELYDHRHNPATPSPIADEERVWAFFGTGLLVCLDAADGSIQWKRDLVQDHGPYDISFGMASSPRMWGENLYIACMTKGPSYVLAVNGKSGEDVWKTPRQYDVADDHPDAYSTPFLWKRGEDVELLVSGAGHIDSYDPRTGKQNWVADGLVIDSQYGRVIASPAADEDTVVATSGNPAGGGKGRVVGIRGRRHRWSYERATPDSSTPVIHDGLVYMVADNGLAACLNVRNGRSIWQKRLGGGPYHASLVAGDGKVYFLGIDGVCTVIQTGRGGRILSRSALPGTFYATPAISDGTIYLRAYEKLYAVKKP
jgi:outer membrane protein assembly factor BamB